MGDNSIEKAIGNGSVVLSMRVGDREVKGVLHEVLHVLGLVGYIHEWGNQKKMICI
jgi:hypothetical protein